MLCYYFAGRHRWWHKKPVLKNEKPIFMSHSVSPSEVFSVGYFRLRTEVTSYQSIKIIVEIIISQGSIPWRSIRDAALNLAGAFHRSATCSEERSPCGVCASRASSIYLILDRNKFPIPIILQEKGLRFSAGRENEKNGRVRWATQNVTQK